MNIIYLINGVDISGLVYGNPKLTKKVGKGTKSFTNNLSINITNEDNGFSPENESSFLYDYREDYSKINVEAYDDEILLWKGIVDNIERDEGRGVLTFICVESIIKILSSPNFIYYSGDGYVGTCEYAGDDVTPAEHQLAILRRYLDEDSIDVGAFKVLKELQLANGIEVSCEIISEDNKTPMTFLTELMMGMGYFIIENNKISTKWYESFTGDLGTNLTDDHIIEITNINKKIQDDIYHSFAITYDNSGTPLEVEGSIGDSGTSDDCTGTILTDSSQEWNIDQWKDKYIFVGTGASKEILKILGNSKTKIYFQNCTKSGAQSYVIVENDAIYQSDYSDFPIKMSGGAAALGSFIVSKTPQSKLQIELKIIDLVNINVGESILLNIPNEGISYQSFEIIELQKNLEDQVTSLTCIDNSMYPIMEQFLLESINKITDLTGFRIEGDGSAVLSWSAIAGASYYRIYYGIKDKAFTYITPNHTAVNVIDNMERWLGYYFWVAAVNFYGIEGELSDPIYLDKIPQAAGYIDGTEGYLVESFMNWGLLEDYYFLLTYKNIGYGDIGFLLKCPFDVLDRSQSTFIEEITQPFEDATAAQMWGSRFRRLGYVDGAGTSTYLPELYDDGGTYYIKNSFAKPLTLNLQSGKTTVAAGAVISGSDDWFVKDYYDNYYTYWFDTGIMMDISNPDANEWFKVWKINQAMGLFENGDGSISNDSETKIGTLTDTSKNWNTNQWEDYYVGIVNSAAMLDIDWYKIKSNTSTTLTFDYGGSDITSKQYIINNESYVGFHGLFVDDVWTGLYQNGINMSTVDDGIAETVAVDYLWDSEKAWMDTWDEGHWDGYYVSINGQTPILIEWSDNNTLYFSGNPTTGSDLSYRIITKFEIDNGMTYADAMADFIEDIVEHVENNSYGLYRNYDRCEKGIFMLNTWPDDFSYYDDFVAAVNKRYQHFVMFEALQMTWNMANEVTKQYIVLDWHEARSRWDQMKISAGIGNARLAILGYPYNQQMMLTHIAGSLMVSVYGNNQMEDITATGNIILDQLFYDMIMAGNEENNKTIGFPESGFEDEYTQNQYDRYGICYRKFEGCHVIYNPSRQYRTIEYLFSEDVVNYYTGEEFEADTLYEFLLPPRTPIFLFRNSSVGFDASQFLNQYKPYSYVDNNMAWVIFTEAGATKIGTDSVWIVNGYTGNKRFVLDGDQPIPEGTPEHLFHAGDGSTTEVIGYDPETENITGVMPDNSVLLTSKTILTVAAIYDNTDSVYLSPGVDYLIEQKEWDATLTGKGKWNTYIHFITDQDTDDLDVYYYEQGIDGDGWPQMIESGSQVEHGVLYRQSSGFALKTGATDEASATTTLVEGTDYYLAPELVRHKWDYRIQPFGIFSTPSTFNAEIPLNMIYAVGGNSNIQGIHWGIIDADNAVLIKSDGEYNNSINGVKATYSSKTITKPKVLIYGFTAPPRNEDTLVALAPASREVDIWTFEYQIQKYIGIYYDEVYVTGDWDGIIEAGASTGSWGSIQGIIDDTGNSFNTWEDIADYFDVVIINDTFLEYGSGSVSGRTQWSSWMDEVDYNFIKGYKLRAKNSERNTILIDRRMGATSFTWWGGIEAVQNILINKGTDLDGDGANELSDLTNIFGCLYYGGQDITDLASSSANVYTKAISGAYVKYSEKFKTDYRIGKKSLLTNHYTFDEDDETNHPILNVWENGGEFLSYIPKSAEGREAISETNQVREKSNLYLKWNDLTSVESGEDEFEKYDQLGLNNIIQRRENLLIFHHWNFFNVFRTYASKTFGNNWTDANISFSGGWVLGNYGAYRGCFFSKNSQALSSFLTGKYIYFREADGDYKKAFSYTGTSTKKNLWPGYTGHYISAVDEAKYTYPASWEMDDFGWTFHEEFQWAYEKIYGFWFPANTDGINWGDVLQFDSWVDSVEDYYSMSKAINADGVFPYERSGEPPLEGAINSITKIGDTLVFDVGFDVTPIDIGEPLLSGIISGGKYSIYDSTKWYLSTNQNVSSYRTGTFYIHITTAAGVEVYPIGNINTWKSPPETLPNNWLSIRHVFGDPTIFNGCVFEIRESNKAYKVATFLTDSDNNLLFNARLLGKDDVNDTITVYCPRGVSQSGAGGYMVAYQADEDEETENPGVISISNKDVLGGRVVGRDDELGADIAETFRSDGELNQTAYLLTPQGLDSATIADKPLSMYHYEWVYKSDLVEFGYEKNTGMVSCQYFFAHQASNRPPVAIWPGMSEMDFHTVVANLIGTTLTFNNLQVAAGDMIYFYYNSFNDMLRIKDEDIENPIIGDKKNGDLKDSNGSLPYAVVRNKTT